MPLKQEWLEQGNFLFRYRSFLPIILLPISLWVIFYNCKLNPDLYQSDYINGLDILAIIIAMSGLLVRIITVGHTPANTSGRNTNEGQVAESVNRSGIYATVRHPLYLGNYLMWLGVAIPTLDVWFLVAFTFAYWLYYERIMYAEEEFLTGKFGLNYTEWASQTPAFIPDFSKWTKPSLPFSIKKVLKKEKNGLFATFLILYIMYSWIDYCKSGDFFLHTKGWTVYVALGTGIFYFIFKMIKRSSALLDEDGR